MNQQNRKKLALLIATVLSGTAVMASCGGNNGEGKPDPTKTTYIYLQNYDCGYGREYLIETAKKFEEAVKDISYEEGKTGVHIEMLHTQTNSTGKGLLTNLPSSQYEVFFTNEIHPTLLKTNGFIMDISDIMNATSADNIGRFAGETSIYDRMYPDWQEYYLEVFTFRLRCTLQSAPSAWSSRRFRLPPMRWSGSIACCPSDCG